MKKLVFFVLFVCLSPVFLWGQTLSIKDFNTRQSADTAEHFKFVRKFGDTLRTYRVIVMIPAHNPKFDPIIAQPDWMLLIPAENPKNLAFKDLVMEKLNLDSTIYVDWSAGVHFWRFNRNFDTLINTIKHLKGEIIEDPSYSYYSSAHPLMIAYADIIMERRKNAKLYGINGRFGGGKPPKITFSFQGKKIETIPISLIDYPRHLGYPIYFTPINDWE